MSNQQRRVETWVTQCFGEDILLNKRERIRRFVEEALELAQATGLTMQDICDVGNYVYARPVGEVPQEVAGCGVTLLGIGAAFGIDVMEEIEKEISRIESIPPDYFRKKHAEKHKAGVSDDTGKKSL